MSQETQQEFRKIQRFILTYHRAFSLQKIPRKSLFSPTAMGDLDQNSFFFSWHRNVLFKDSKQSQSLEMHLGGPESGFGLAANPDCC